MQYWIPISSSPHPTLPGWKILTFKRSAVPPPRQPSSTPRPTSTPGPKSTPAPPSTPAPFSIPASSQYISPAPVSQAHGLTISIATQTDISDSTLVAGLIELEFSSREAAWASKEAKLQKREDILRARDAGINAREAGVRSREAEVAAREADVASEEAAVEARTRKLAEREAEVVDVGRERATLLLRGQTLARREQELKEREAEFDALKNSFEQHMRKEKMEVQAQAGEYFAKRRAVDDKELELIAREEELQILARNHDVVRKDEKIGALEFAILKRDEEFKIQARALAEKDKELKAVLRGEIGMFGEGLHKYWEEVREKQQSASLSHLKSPPAQPAGFGGATG